MAKSADNSSADPLVAAFHGTIMAIVKADERDLSARQLAVFLQCYLVEAEHTVRGLAAAMDVSKPAVTRALDRLGEMDLARRKIDPRDRRSVIVVRTLKGAGYMRELKGFLHGALKAVGKGAKAA